MTKYTIEKIIGTYTQSKDGKPFVTKMGKPYSKSTVLFKGDKRFVTICVWQGKECREGMEIEGDITEREYNGKKYYDFQEATEKKKILTETEGLKTSVARLRFDVDMIGTILKRKFPSDFGAIAQNGVTSAGNPPVNFDKPNTPEQAKDFMTKQKAYDEELLEDLPF